MTIAGVEMMKVLLTPGEKLGSRGLPQIGLGKKNRGVEKRRGSRE